MVRNGRFNKYCVVVDVFLCDMKRRREASLPAVFFFKQKLSIYLIIPAFLRVLYAPFFLMFLIADVEIFITKVTSNSGT
jgi:hypothetical protein